METVCAESELQNASDKTEKNKTSNEKSVCFTTPPCKGPAVNWEFTPFISGNTMHITLTYNNWDGYKVAVLYLLKSVTCRWPWSRRC